MTSRLPRFTRNFYFLFSVFFLFWMLFMDSNNVFTQLSLKQKKSELTAQKDYYAEKIKEVKVERAELLSNPELLEKFAREKYLMKKENEDLYVLVEKE